VFFRLNHINKNPQYLKDPNLLDGDKLSSSIETGHWKTEISRGYYKATPDFQNKNSKVLLQVGLKNTNTSTVGKNLSLTEGYLGCTQSSFSLLSDFEKYTGKRLRMNYLCIQMVLRLMIKDFFFFCSRNPKHILCRSPSFFKKFGSIPNSPVCP